MDLEKKLDNPIIIRIEKDGNVSIIDEESNEVTSIPKGVMFGSSHFGFIIICESGTIQRELVYKTQRRVDAIDVKNGYIRVFEEGVRDSWCFSNTGNKLEEISDKPHMLNIVNKAMANSDTLLGEDRIENPIIIYVGADKKARKIIFNESDEYKLNPGVIIDSEHHGFILIRNVHGKQIERVYPTQNRIQAIGVCSQSKDDEFDVFEEGKYFPWIFSGTGKLIRTSSYNEMNSEDKKFVSKMINKTLILK